MGHPLSSGPSPPPPTSVLPTYPFPWSKRNCLPNLSPLKMICRRLSMNSVLSRSLEADDGSAGKNVEWKDLHLVGGRAPWLCDLQSKYLLRVVVGVPCDPGDSFLRRHPNRCPKKHVQNNYSDIVCLAKSQKQPTCPIGQWVSQFGYINSVKYTQ